MGGAPGWRLVAVYALAGALPDIDFLLPLRHRGPSHSLGAAVLVAAVTLALTAWLRGAPHWRIAAAGGLAYLSHALLDWLGADSSAPRGLMALWPVSHTYYVSGVDLFNAVDRRYWLPGFWTRNLVALARELVILGPCAAISVSAARRWRSYLPRAAAPPPG